ncbi:hypothetical protein Taro_030186 [Colocasia esculenta]|uniref:Uncharacterized protein n=1 Tax=Colocasia esculenta TaxID=4460 RepID=A0A843VKT7_COLES|nr:hypothetical protein [Colocasia esculenta]
MAESGRVAGSAPADPDPESGQTRPESGGVGLSRPGKPVPTVPWVGRCSPPRGRQVDDKLARNWVRPDGLRLTQDTQLLLWDLVMDEIVLPLRRYSGGSPTYSGGSHSAHWDNIHPVGTLQPSPSARDIPKLSPVVAHRADLDPLSGIIFTSESVLTICREGHLKVWVRPGHAGDSQSSTSEAVLSAVTKESPVTRESPVTPTVKSSSSSYNHPGILMRN